MSRPKGWTVRAAYIAADKTLKWGEFHHSVKARAMTVYRNLHKGCEKIQVLKAGVVQWEARKGEVVSLHDLSEADLKELSEWLN